MKMHHIVVSTSKNLFGQSFIIETLLGICCLAFLLTGLSLWQAINLPSVAPVYYVVDQQGQLHAAQTTSIDQWSDPQSAVLGQEIAR